MLSLNLMNSSRRKNYLKKMKIGIVIMDLSVSGGAQRQALELAQKLVRFGHEVKIYARYYDPNACYPELTKNLNIDALYLSKRELPQKPFSFWAKLVNFIKTKKDSYVMSKRIASNIELLNCHDQDTQWVGYFFKQKHPKIPIVWMCNDLPWVFIAPEKGIINFLISSALSFIEIKIAKKINQIIVLDFFNQRRVQKYYKRAAKVIRSGIDTKQFQPPAKREFKKNYIKILAVGVFLPHRRFEDLIEAAKILKSKGFNDFEINIIGKQAVLDRSYYDFILSLVKKYSLSQKVNFLGQVSEKELLGTYQENDIFVFPNHNQTWGLAVFEAMLCGLTVIVSKTAGASEVLTDYQDAFLIPPKKPKILAQKILELYQNPKLRENISRAGREFVLKNLSWEKYARAMEREFRQALR